MMEKKNTIMYVRANGIYSDSRATKQITSFLKAGYQVLIVGWDREGNSKNKCEEVFSEYKNAITYSMYDKQVKDHVGLGGLWKLYGWLRFVKMTYLKYKSDIAVVHGCNLDSCLLCYKRIQKDGVKFVYDIYDYYTDVHIIPLGLTNQVEKLEIGMINSADFTIICTEERREQIAKATPKKIVVIHNSPDVDYLQRDLKYDYFYCGTFCIRRLIQEIFDEYPNNSDLKFGYAGYGVYKDQATELDKKYENFTYLGQVKYAECLEQEARSISLSSVLEPTVRNHRLCAPNKFYESLALGKPIIVCKGTGIDRIVEKYDIGVVIDYDVKQFYDAVRKLKNDPDYCKDMGKRARKLYEEKYSWAIMEGILINAYKELYD